MSYPATHAHCSLPNCTEPVVITGDDTPVSDLCRAHGNQVVDLISRIDLPSDVPVSFDAIRDRWRRGYNLLHN